MAQKRISSKIKLLGSKKEEQRKETKFKKSKMKKRCVFRIGHSFVRNSHMISLLLLSFFFVAIFFGAPRWGRVGGAVGPRRKPSTRRGRGVHTSAPRPYTNAHVRTWAHPHTHTHARVNQQDTQSTTPPKKFKKAAVPDNPTQKPIDGVSFFCGSLTLYMCLYIYNDVIPRVSPKVLDVWNVLRQRKQSALWTWKRDLEPPTSTLTGASRL